MHFILYPSQTGENVLQHLNELGIGLLSSAMESAFLPSFSLQKAAHKDSQCGSSPSPCKSTNTEEAQTISPQLLTTSSPSLQLSPASPHLRRPHTNQPLQQHFGPPQTQTTHRHLAPAPSNRSSHSLLPLTMLQPTRDNTTSPQSGGGGRHLYCACALPTAHAPAAFV